MNTIVSIDLTKLTICEYWKRHLDGMTTLFLNSELPSNVAIKMLTGESPTLADADGRVMFLSVLETRINTDPSWVTSENIMAIAGALATPEKKAPVSVPDRSGSATKIYKKD